MRRGRWAFAAALVAGLLVPTQGLAQGYGNEAGNTIVDVAIEAGRFETLVRAVQAAGLVEVLTYHVIPGKVMAEDVIASQRVRPETVQGSMLNIRVADGSVRVDDAMVVQPDVEASNGVIHVIDTVVLPASLRAAAEY